MYLKTLGYHRASASYYMKWELNVPNLHSQTYQSAYCLTFGFRFKLQLSRESHLHFQTASHGRSCPPLRLSSTACSGWDGSPGRWCSSSPAPAHWTLPCGAQFSWSRGGWRIWWKAWRNLKVKRQDRHISAEKHHQMESCCRKLLDNAMHEL